jgi:hypothetical protein
LLLLAAIGAVCVVAGIGCSRGRPPQRVARPATARAAQSESDAARAAVVDYLQALQSGDYGAAYALLSAESRKLHPAAQFERQAKQGITIYDLASAQARLTRTDRAEVRLRLENDPASTAVVAVREGGQWRVVYRRGRPGFPYP